MDSRFFSYVFIVTCAEQPWTPLQQKQRLLFRSRVPSLQASPPNLRDGPFRRRAEMLRCRRGSKARWNANLLQLQLRIMTCKIYIKQIRHNYVRAQVNGERGFVEAVYHLHVGPINCLVLHAGFAVTASDDGFVRIWPLDFQDFLLEADHSVAITSVRPFLAPRSQKFRKN